MLFPLPLSSTQKFLSSVDVLEQILFLSCLSDDALGPPLALLPLSLTCKYFAATLSTSNNPTFFDRLFLYSFGISAQRFVAPGNNVQCFVQLFWTALKKFRNVHCKGCSLSDIGANDWNLVSTFISLLTLRDRQAFRQLNCFAHIETASRVFLLDALHRPSGRSCSATWQALGIWWVIRMHGARLSLNIFEGNVTSLQNL